MASNSRSRSKACGNRRSPLAQQGIGLIAIHSNINVVFGEIVKAGVPNPFSWHWGVYVLGLAAVVLAAQALKPAAK